MKTLRFSLLLASVLSLPVMAHAQVSSSVTTRAQVRAELIQLEKAGYKPGHPSPYYPADIQVAEARVRQMNGADNLVQPIARNARSDVGGVMSGMTESGARLVASGSAKQSPYMHH
ncbi:hypothetical protein EOS_09025 [Caballeronia mineralivorans PML1(12)]|uniref:Purine nucleoside phosphorylase n=1 Tax=Caballeronia mineralivorans PML1(12) TaxID=908627 RepID=A0A0J1D119_9BURK|nr:DUF4148 domain-containing protein [Caballeronia mineralivorans]KLU26474.1 hypothetical protein EOS_09025 [Caballeronia mineralivorans PML1(12)]